MTVVDAVRWRPARRIVRCGVVAHAHRPALAPEQLRADMVAVGMRLLAERGLNVGLDTVRFDEVVRAADAPRASAYRAWSDSASEVGPQVRFHRALAAELLREEPGFGDSPAVVQGAGPSRPRAAGM